VTARPGVTLRRRLAAQRLTDPPHADVVDGVSHLLAVQAQDPRGARLALRARSRGLHASDVDRALTDDRSVVVSWLNRGTLHLVLAEDYWWLHALTTPPLAAGCARRLAQEGVGPADIERGVALIRSMVDRHGPTKRSEFRERLASTGVPVKGQALVHLLFAATLRGHIVRGPVVDGEQAFVAVEDWFGAAPPLPAREDMLARLAARYLAAHGPASDRDLARWSGLSLGDARAGLRGVNALVELPDGLVELPGGGRGDPGVPPPLLLGAFDPLLLGWVSRADVLGDVAGVVTTNGVFRPFVLVGGRAVARWGLPGKRVSIADAESLPAAVRTALAAEAAAVEAFLAARD
jgi:Winged helix DNA-binding domain